MIHPLNAVFPGLVVQEVVLEMSLVVCLSSLRGARSPQELLSQAQDGVPGSGVRHRILLQPSNGCVQEHVAHA